MTTTDTTATTVNPQSPDHWLASFGTLAYGVPVVDFGEDGEMAAIGHHEPRRVIAAMNAHYRHEHHTDTNNQHSQGIRPRMAGDLYPGIDLAWQKQWWSTYIDAASDLRYQWWRLVDRCEQTDQPDHHEHTDCARCAALADSTWVAVTVPAGTPGAFPVVIWEP